MRFENALTLAAGIAMVSTNVAVNPGGAQEAPQPDTLIQAVPMEAVTLKDSFWRPRLETNRTVTIPHVMRQNESTGRVANFSKGAGKLEGAYEGRRFNDTDVYKIIEAASYSLATHSDPALEGKLDKLIELIAAAQEEDGSLATTMSCPTCAPIPKPAPPSATPSGTSECSY